jgi:hypothetical protein
MLQRRWLRWILVFARWTCVGLFFASQTYLAYKYSGGQAHIGIVLKLNQAANQRKIRASTSVNADDAVTQSEDDQQ